MRVPRKRESLFLFTMALVLLGGFAIRAYGTTGTIPDPNSPSAWSSHDANELRWDLAESFTFSWESAELSAKVVNSTQSDAGESNVPVRTLTVSASVDWNPLKAGGLVIIDVNTPQVCELLDQGGDPVQYQNAQSDQYRCYRDRKWYWPWESQAVATEPLCCSVKVHVCADANQSMPTTISVLKGYLWAIYADAVICVAVPFDPNCGSIETEAAPDFTFTVDPTMPPVPEPIEYVRVLLPTGDTVCRPKRATGLYKYQTWVKSKTGQPVLTLRERIQSPGKAYAFGDYAMVRTELFDSQKRVSQIPVNEDVLSVLWNARGVLCSGETAQLQNISFDTIWHIVAVHPVEVKIPFVLRDIPVSGFHQMVNE